MKTFDTPQQQHDLAELKRVRSEAVEHFYAAARLAQQRRKMILDLCATGFSLADIGRELGVSRQAVAKMVKVGRPSPHIPAA